MPLIIWLGLGVAAMIIGSRKGIGFIASLLWFVLGPVGLLIILLMKGNRKRCPYCKVFIHHDAIVCPRCQREQPGNPGGAKPRTFVEGLKKGME
jgi:hypothetical protein